MGKQEVESFKPLNRLIGDTDSTIRQFDESTTNNGIATSAIRPLFTERSISPPRNDGFGERHCEERYGNTKVTQIFMRSVAIPLLWSRITIGGLPRRR